MQTAYGLKLPFTGNYKGNTPCTEGIMTLDLDSRNKAADISSEMLPNLAMR
jgi:hypothetical protein